jgi:hypothetical protein
LYFLSHPLWEMQHLRISTSIPITPSPSLPKITYAVKMQMHAQNFFRFLVSL